MKRILSISCILQFILASNSFAIGTKDVNIEMTGKSKALLESTFGGRNNIKRIMVEDDIKGLRGLFTTFSQHVIVPGFISASPLSRIAKVVGPDYLGTSIRIGDTVYIRWLGSPGPRVGDKYHTFRPAIVLQNMDDASDFLVRAPYDAGETPSKEHRLAGYLYEVSGTFSITKVGQGLVEAVLEQVTSPIMAGDEVMPYIPPVEELRPQTGGIQISAALVSGSPSYRLSTSKRSFIYLNRGTRDGIKPGRVFQSIEFIKLSDNDSATPEVSTGEAMVVYSTDAYSTAMITEQFDVIRVGGLMKTKQTPNHINAKAPFASWPKNGALKGSTQEMTQEDPLDLDLPAIPDGNSTSPSLTAPPQMPRAKDELPPLSELDALERNQNLPPLSEQEKNKLNKLSKQSKIANDEAELSDTGDTLGVPAMENSFRQGKSKKDNKKKKKNSTNDEEELNLLMMQN